MLPVLAVAVLVLAGSSALPPSPSPVPPPPPQPPMLLAARAASAVGAGSLGATVLPPSALARVGGPASDVVPAGQGVWPLQPRPSVVRDFDPPANPYAAGHRGVDLLGTAGQVVHTSLAGRITFAGPLAGRGVVVVDHGTVRTTYEPVAATVQVGAAVARGQPIGTLQTGGSHCPPHACLHWGLLRGSEYLDPLMLVDGLPVRLLPLRAPAFW